ncbi:hypothetical protein E2C01_093448 [Portunus trituberculatus]|uniref:Uncharacterized protein n=1 Tax=Portunus trituberculatus TaxID=210409 RepID=A0A5B7JUT8_PORTR|nr:hypothetical protein [Portunus trituberculatus]
MRMQNRLRSPHLELANVCWEAPMQKARPFTAMTRQLCRSEQMCKYAFISFSKQGERSNPSSGPLFSGFRI